MSETGGKLTPEYSRFVRRTAFLNCSFTRHRQAECRAERVAGRSFLIARRRKLFASAAATFGVIQRLIRQFRVMSILSVAFSSKISPWREPPHAQGRGSLAQSACSREIIAWLMLRMKP